MTREIALGALWNTFTAPSDQYILRETGVGVNNLDVGELYATLGEFLDQIIQFTVYQQSARGNRGRGGREKRKRRGGLTSSGLDFENTFFVSGILLKGIDEGG